MMAHIGIAAMNSRIGTGGGVDVYTRELVAALAEYGSAHIYSILAGADTMGFWSFREWPSHIQFVPLQEREPSRYQLLLALLKRVAGLAPRQRYQEFFLARQIAALRLDAVHFPSTIIYPLVVQTPCVLTFFDMQHEYYPQFFTEDELAARARTYRPSVAKAAYLIVPSDFTRRSLNEKYGAPFGKMSLIPVGISETFRRKEAAEVERVRAKYRLPNEFIFYPANPWQHKNHARLMAALRIYRERHGACPWLVLTGRLHWERREAMSLAIAAGVEDRVMDLAFVEQADLPALYSAAQLMVFPSLFEGFGIPLVEALACGCPIAAADATTIPEITNGAALLFDPLDPEQMAVAIHRVLNDADLRQALVARGYAQLPRFAWNSVVSQLTAVYERVASENRLLQGHERPRWSRGAVRP